MAAGRLVRGRASLGEDPDPPPFPPPPGAYNEAQWLLRRTKVPSIRSLHTKVMSDTDCTKWSSLAPSRGAQVWLW